jgi:hypothetical protein
LTVTAALGGLCGTSTAGLLGVQPGFPKMFFDNQGTTTYQASDGSLSIVGLPSAIRFSADTAPVLVMPTGNPPSESATVNVVLDGAGNLVGGVPGDDLIVIGQIDADGDNSPDFAGVLLTGEVLAFGFLEAGTTDVFDFSFQVTGGSLAPLYGGADALLVISSESSSFNGSFGVDFDGEAKGVMGPGEPPTGACCLPDGTCEISTQDDCARDGGLYQGDDTVCTPELCPEIKGACCFADGTCAVLEEDECAAAGGIYQGDGTTCQPELCPPPQGACCLPNGDCVQATQDECNAQGGAYQGNNTMCAPGLCPEIKGACCFPNGSCAAVTEEECAAGGGAYQGDNTVCTPGLCPPPSGACCLPSGMCIIATQDDCMAQGGLYQGNNTMCAPGLCQPPDGACCFENGTCLVLTEKECAMEGGIFQGPGTVCMPTTCPHPGACCFPDGSCQGGLQEQDCIDAGGIFQGEDTDCDPNPCPHACCLDDGSCVVVGEADCLAQGGEFQDGVSCDPNPCAVAGACCIQGVCGEYAVCEEVGSADECADLGGEFFEGEDCGGTTCFGEGEDCCDDDDKVKSLLMLYTGDDCSATSHSQDRDKVDCDDFGRLTATVFIRVSNKSNPNDGSAKIWFEGNVDVGGTFVIDAANAGETKLAADTWIHIFSKQGGVQLQKVKFHTSCSQPLFTGDQFGAAKVLDCMSEDECSCCKFGKPRVLTMLHTGSDCSGTMHSQDDDKVNCDDFGPLTDPVYILATNKANPNDASAMVWFAGTVAAGQTYDIDAGNEGLTKLTNTTYIHIFDMQGGTQLQKIEFHTSCSQPLNQGDQYGSAQLVDCIGEDEPVLGACCLPAARFECSDKIEFMTLIWDGSVPVRIKVYDGLVGAPVIADIDNIQVGDTVTVGPYAGPNDNVFEVFHAGTSTLLGLSKFHRSCSDDDMDGPEDCGKRQGNGKQNEAGLLNDWILEGLVDGTGASFVCSGNGDEGSCEIISADDCAERGGTYQGDGTDCGNVTCTGACCLPEVSPDFECMDKIEFMTLIWDGRVPVRIKVYDGLIGAPVIADIDNIQVGDTITVGPYAGPNDNVFEVFHAGTNTLLGLSKFHRSCSDDDMDGPEDCGKRQGNGKMNEAGLLNDWILEGLVDGSGASFVCSGNGDEGSCEILSAADCAAMGGTFKGDSTACESVDCTPPAAFCVDGAKPKVLVMEYTGDNCGATQHSQDRDKVECAGNVDFEPLVRIRASDSSNPNDAGAAVYHDAIVMLGGSFEVDATMAGDTKLATNTWLHIFQAGGGPLLQTVKFHTSCSQPLNAGDQYGAAKLVDFIPE